MAGTSLVVHWLRLQAPSAGDLGLIPGLGNRPHMPQLGVCMLQLKIPHAAKIVIPPTTTKTWRSHIKNKKDLRG